ncbi:Putative signal peptide peptidase SppA [Sedimentisphaera cyanobacteriorum]|uniref:Signal peptide peptidase SppA n=1 Tax=Sedimentisphaera cyanobacteriorum TaxID=1940790 RepID=A0A1Q2HPY7_9BACT|nr:S49 family peptidase [Sedimentisphaera cyanobacteriorum]AQQ09305.1 Putative signal peptide peptidase SppA [Sedimentisphaera cyanobacteriorum]
MDEDYKNQNSDENAPFEKEDDQEQNQDYQNNERLELSGEPEGYNTEEPAREVKQEQPAKEAAQQSKKGDKKAGKKPEKEPKKKKGFWCRLWSAMKFIYMVITVPYFIMVVLFIVAFLAAVFSHDEFIDIEEGSRLARGGFNETVIMEGSRDNRIALIDVQNLITFETSQKFRSQIKKAQKDDSVAALIVRVTSPGGSVSASDQIHHYIESFQKDTGIPVYSFMSGVAASGGYYVSAACDEIYAEPTTITGSIGVISRP